ncbi:MAG: hypothetical protein HOP18_24200 [Deltaproteobacteria bacterium]|nr:hypothetical protein [Deltaproteobacteria bacterium]
MKVAILGYNNAHCGQEEGTWKVIGLMRVRHVVLATSTWPSSPVTIRGREGDERLSQDSNIYRANFIDGAGRKRYFLASKGIKIQVRKIRKNRKMRKAISCS